MALVFIRRKDIFQIKNQHEWLWNPHSYHNSAMNLLFFVENSTRTVCQLPLCIICVSLSSHSLYSCVARAAKPRTLPKLWSTWPTRWELFGIKLKSLSSSLVLVPTGPPVSENSCHAFFSFFLSLASVKDSCSQHRCQDRAAVVWLTSLLLIPRSTRNNWTPGLFWWPWRRGPLKIWCRWLKTLW